MNLTLSVWKERPSPPGPDSLYLGFSLNPALLQKILFQTFNFSLVASFASSSFSLLFSLCYPLPGPAILSFSRGASYSSLPPPPHHPQSFPVLPLVPFRRALPPRDPLPLAPGPPDPVHLCLPRPYAVIIHNGTFTWAQDSCHPPCTGTSFSLPFSAA